LLQLHNLTKSVQTKKKRKRVGRGNASGKGTYSGRGLKGQRSRSGGKKGLKLKGFKRNLLNLPKFKGNKSLRPNNQVVGLAELNQEFKADDKVNPAVLLKKGLISNNKAKVKILNKGEISVKLKVSGCLVSKAAKQAIEKAGGLVSDDQQNNRPKKQDSKLHVAKKETNKK